MDAIIGLGLRETGVSPVQLRSSESKAPHWCRNERIARGIGAGFDDENPKGGIAVVNTRSERAPSEPATDNYVVRFLCSPLLWLP